jgi:hypothetical protein
VITTVVLATAIIVVTVHVTATGAAPVIVIIHLVCNTKD